MQQWHDFLTSPDNRTFFAQLGVSLLQPQGPGQSLVGAVGRAVGEGFEAKDRATEAQNALAQQSFTNALEQRKQAAVESENASQAALRAQEGKYYEDRVALAAQMRNAGDNLNAWARIADNAQQALTLMDETDPEYMGTLTRLHIANANVARLSGGSSRGGGDTGAGASVAPPPGAPPGTKMAPDGNWYAPDPTNPGKWLRYTPGGVAPAGAP